MNNNFEILDELFIKYKFTIDEKSDFLKIIEPIFFHDEFQKRLNAKDFPHHGDISLGNHIVSDAMVTYILAKKKKAKGHDIDIEVAVYIAMFHDLYELPWQNSSIKKERFVNRHGFIHPIEAAINAINWYPTYFNDLNKAEKIIDGILHHMYPFPVRKIKKNFKDLELNNISKLDNIADDIKNLIVECSIRRKVGPISLSRSKYIEGRIMSKADKKVSLRKELKSTSSLVACITGKNKKLDKTKN